MIPRIPRTKGKGVGKSFKGTAAYLLHDKDMAETDDRVLWTETRNIGTDNPELAARIMAATAMDADRLKRAHHEAEQAKLPEDERTPYKASKASFNHVFHYSLSWSGEHDAPSLTREEMIRAAYSSLRELGADHLQALVVAHEAEANPHVHVMVNRINPDTGRTETPESNAKYRLSEWALKYERQRGQILCKEREKNAALRAAELPYDQYQDQNPKQHRDEQRAAAETVKRDPQGAAEFRKKQNEADRKIGRKARELDDKHRQQWQDLGKDHRFRKALINQEADEGKTLADRQIRKSYVPKFEELRAQQSQEFDQFVERESTLRGKVVNIGKSLKSVFQTREDGDKNMMSQAFDVLGNSGARYEALKRAQAMAEKTMNSQMKREIGDAVHSLDAARSAAISANYDRFTEARSDLKLSQAADKAAIHAAWKKRDEDRVQGWKEFDARTRFEKDYDEAVQHHEADRKRREEDRKQKSDKRRARDQDTSSEPIFDAASTKADAQHLKDQARDDFQKSQERERSRERRPDDE